MKTAIKPRWRRKLRAALLNIDSKLARLSARSRLLSTAYAVGISRSFSREMHAVMVGRLLHQRHAQPDATINYKMRRQIHRVEKALCMRPRRDLFAVDYIGDLTESFCRAIAARPAGHLSAELFWAHDVLATYFGVVSDHPTVAVARCSFREACAKRPELVGRNASFAPYRRDVSRPPPVTSDDLLALAVRRRSCRWFLNEQVPRDLLDRAIEIAAYSPSACNRQPFEFRIFDEGKLPVEVARLAMGTSGFADNLPVTIAVVGKQRAYKEDRDRHVIYVDAGLAVMSLILALETMGLSSCTINWPDIESRERKMAKLLRLQGDERVVMLIGVGFPDPDGMVPYSRKLPVELMRRYG